MRVLILIACLAGAAPALAQNPPYTPAPYIPPSSAWRPQDLEQQQQHEQLRQEMIRQQNQLMSLEAQTRAQQAMRDIEAQKQSPSLGPSAVPTPPPNMDLGAMASIPDSVLAESNRRAVDASRNRR